MDKCDKCRLWVLGCELDGSARRNCKKLNYKFFKPKALGYSQRGIKNEKSV